uniref:C2H2-type domain-containing protein n=1 Tax=Peronospora matthiolae TaxID=2874970 RepID=A0AAV1VNX9_9STRA
MPCGDEPSFAGPCPHDDDCTPGRAGTMLPVGDAQAPATTAAVPMEVDQCATWQAASLTPPSPPLVLRLSGKRRRLSDEDDGDEPREQAEQLLLEDVEAGPMNSALWPSTASALPASVLAVYAHNAQRFTCMLCTYTASSFASLKRHRDSRHRRITFLDLFSAGCACGTPFVSRLAAANHARACASLRDTSAATTPAAGDLSPTAGAVNATATVADTEPVLPRQDPPVLAVSPHSRAPRMTGLRNQDGALRSQDSWLLRVLRHASPRFPPHVGVHHCLAAWWCQGLPTVSSRQS